MDKSIIRRGKYLVRMLCSVPFLLSLIFAQSAQQQRTVRLVRPVAIDKGSSSDVFVLDYWGTVHRLRQTGHSLSELGSFNMSRSAQVYDVTYSNSGGQESLLIAGVEAQRAFVWRYSLNGRVLQFWNLRNVGVGIDFNTTNHSAYLATSDSKEIYQVELNTDKVSFVTQIPAAKRLGPLVIDDKKQILYVADVTGGAIYQYSIGAKSSKLLVSGLSAPTALFFDPETARLYIADAGRRKILILDTRGKKPILKDFASGPLKSPSGVTLLSDGDIAVTDLDANCVFLFSSQGTLVSRFPN